MYKDRMANATTLRWGKGLFIYSLVCLFLLISFIIAFDTTDDYRILALGGMGAILISYCCYPFIIRYNTSKSQTYFSSSSFGQQIGDSGITNLIEWRAIKSYRIYAFESLAGSGFTFKYMIKME